MSCSCWLASFATCAGATSATSRRTPFLLPYKLLKVIDRQTSGRADQLLT